MAEISYLGALQHASFPWGRAGSLIFDLGAGAVNESEMHILGAQHASILRTQRQWGLLGAQTFVPHARTST